MYEKCVKCPKVGVTCEGPHFFTMPAEELLDWCKERKKFLKLSNEKLSELTYMQKGNILTGVPKGTIDRLFSGEHLDFKYETMRPIIKVLAGGEFVEAPCPEEPNNFADENICRLEEENARLKEHLVDEQEKTSFFKEQYSFRGKAIIALTAFLGISILLIFAALIIDLANHDVGFFWVA